MRLLEPLEVVKLAASRGKSRSKTSVRFDIAAGRLVPFAYTGRNVALLDPAAVDAYIASL